MTPEKRQEVITAAKTWLRTPYHHMGKVKGSGVDCAMFPLAVYQECGVLPEDFIPPEYAMQWHLHRSEELYLQTIEPFTQEFRPCLCRCIKQDYVTCVCSGNSKKYPLPADFVVLKFGRAFSHGAIVVSWPIVIHSYIPHGVLLSDAERDGELLGRERKFFEVKG